MSALLTPSDYPADYVEVPFTTDEQALADGAVANLQATWADWTPNDGDLEVVLIETLSPYASAAAQNAAQMPPAAFIALGTKLYGIAYGQGIPASTTVTLTFQDDAGGYDVPAASEFDLGGYAFQTVSDVTSEPGSAIATGIPVIANDIGVTFNGLTSADWSSVTMPVWVTNLTTEAATEGGVDAQDDYDYLNYFSRELQLRGRMIVTLSDYEIAAINTDEAWPRHAATTACGSPPPALPPRTATPSPLRSRATSPRSTTPPLWSTRPTRWPIPTMPRSRSPTRSSLSPATTSTRSSPRSIPLSRLNSRRRPGKTAAIGTAWPYCHTTGPMTRPLR